MTKSIGVIQIIRGTLGRRRGSKISQKSITNYLNGPLSGSYYKSEENICFIPVTGYRQMVTLQCRRFQPLHQQRLPSVLSQSVAVMNCNGGDKISDWL